MTASLSRLFSLACVLASPAALAQTYPDRNVTIVVTTAAGALTDTLTRAVAQQLSEMWKQSVIVENRSGAGYSIAAQSVMRGEHDGYTLLASETAAPSSLASTANRLTATQSAFPETINDFCNEIGTKLPFAGRCDV